MPSYQYTRNITPEDKEPYNPPELSKKDKAKNWWHYNHKWLIAAIIALAIVAYLIIDVVTKVKPDYTIGIITGQAIPDDITAHLESEFATLLSDKNGDGRVVVSVDVFHIQVPFAPTPQQSSSSESDAHAPPVMLDPNIQMASVTRLSGALSSGDIMLFIVGPGMEAAIPFQIAYGIFAYQDGTSPPDSAIDVENMSVAWEDLPTLAALDLNVTNADGKTFNFQPLMADFRIGIRPCEGTLIEGKPNKEKDWQEARTLLQTWGWKS